MANSQWGTAFSERVGMVPALKTSSLSSSVVPTGTIEFGRLGILYNKVWSASVATFNSSESTVLEAFSSAVFCLNSLAFWACPDLNNSPISFEIAFNSEEIVSTCVWSPLRDSSSFITASMSDLASFVRLLKRARTSAWCSLM